MTRPLWHDTVADEREAERLQRVLRDMRKTLAAIDNDVADKIEREAKLCHEMAREVRDER